MKVVVIIPARGGSKGIPKKNLRVLGNKPLIAHTILQAQQSKLVSDVYVSSDCDEILSISEDYNARGIQRPLDISDDIATSESALAHALAWLKRDRCMPDYLVFLQCTSPFRKATDIDLALEKVISEQADSLLSVVPNHRFLWGCNDGEAHPINYDYQNRPRRQDMPIQYQENGSIYIFKPWVLEKYNNRLGGKISLFEMDEKSALDIDSELDFRMAEVIYNFSVDIL